ncbi:4570_t:CDS:2, partial [Paraglomus brasilianum]
HGRAIEALEAAVKDYDLNSCNFENIVHNVKNMLTDRYCEWIQQVTMLTPVLRAILAHTRVAKSEHIPRTNLYPDDVSRFGLIMADASQDPMLQNWRFAYYMEEQTKNDPLIPPGAQFSDMHYGARHNFGELKFLNMPLQLIRATHRVDTKSSENTTMIIQCEQGSVDVFKGHYCVINAAGAPSGDVFCGINLYPDKKITEVYRAKLRATKKQNVSNLFEEERRKATNIDHDVFLLYTTGNCSDIIIPPGSAVVDVNNWNSYFGPFAGRTFSYGTVDQPNANNALLWQLTGIHGISEKRAHLLIKKRPMIVLRTAIEKRKYQKDSPIIRF